MFLNTTDFVSDLNRDERGVELAVDVVDALDVVVGNLERLDC